MGLRVDSRFRTVLLMGMITIATPADAGAPDPDDGAGPEVR